MSSTLLPECPNCSTATKTVPLSLGDGILKCVHCGFSREFKEVSGAILNSGHGETFINVNSFLWMQNYSEPPEEVLRVNIEDYFPEEPYDGCKKVAKYKLKFDWKLEIYYD